MVGLFEVFDIFGAVMAVQLKSLFDTYDLTNHILVYVTDERGNLQTMADPLWFVVTFDPLYIQSVFEGTCFSHVMSTTFQSATDDLKVTIGLKEVSFKNAQACLLKP